MNADLTSIRDIRVLWVSNSRRAKTGYGNQTNLFAPRLKAAGYGVAIFAFWGQEGSPMIDEDGIITLPRFMHPYGNDIIAAHADHVGADIVFNLFDPFVGDKNIYGRLNTAHWTPVDSEPIFPGNADFLREAVRWPVAMSRYGQRQMEQAGFKDPLYIPHGVDTTVYQPVNRDEARAKLSQAWGIDLSGRFLVTMNSANKGVPSRKGFFEAFAAFKLFLDQRPDALLYVHSETSGVFQGEHLPTHARMCNIPEGHIIYAPQYQLVTGMLPDAYLNDVYNASDVFLQTSHGEGFGIPIMEAQAAGCPVIVTDFSAMSEICLAGWKVPGMPFCPVPGVTQRLPVISEVVKALDKAHSEASTLRIRAAALAQAYSVDNVFNDYMLPVFERMEAKVKQERETSNNVFVSGQRRDEVIDVSVLIPCYNLERYANPRRALDSALEQEGVVSEVILVDDGSDDNTWDIIQAWAKDDGRISAHQCSWRFNGKTNGSDLPTNIAARHASGRYLIWGSLRAWYEPGAFKVLVDALDANPGIGFVYGDTRYYGDENRYHKPPAFNRADFIRGFPSLQAYLYRRELFEQGARYWTPDRPDVGRVYPYDRDHAMTLIFDFGQLGLKVDKLIYHYTLDLSNSMTGDGQRSEEMKALWTARWGALESVV